MNAEFQWWLLILGIVIGGALVYLVLAEVQGDQTSADEFLGPRPDADPTTDSPGPPEVGDPAPLPDDDDTRRPTSPGLDPSGHGRS